MYKSPENSAFMKRYRASMRECIRMKDCTPVPPNEYANGEDLMGADGDSYNYPTKVLQDLRNQMWKYHTENNMKAAWRIHDTLPFIIERDIADYGARADALEFAQREGRVMSYSKPKAAFMGTARGGGRGGGRGRQGGFRVRSFSGPIKRGNPWGRSSVFYNGITYLTPCDFDPYSYDCLLFENERRDIMVGNGTSYYSRVQSSALFPRLNRQ